MAYLLRLTLAVLGLLCVLGLAANDAHALIQRGETYTIIAAGQNVSGSTAVQACTAFAAALNARPADGYTHSFHAIAGTSCEISSTNGGTGGYNGISSWNLSITGGSCPANSTEVNQTQCQCNTGATEVGAQCVLLPQECTAKRGQEYSPASSKPLGSGDTLPAAGQAALLQPVPTCVDKCGVAGGALRAERSLARTWTLIIPALNYTGGSCSQASGDLAVNNKWDTEIQQNAEPPVPCPAGKLPGELNGVTVCMPSGATAGATNSSSSSSGTTATTGGTNGNGTGTGEGGGSGPSVIGGSGPSNSSDTSITTCDGTTCTTTTTSTATAGKPSGSGTPGGGGTSTEQCAQAAASAASAPSSTGATCTNTSTTTKPQADYCKENPKKVECVNDSSKTSFSGNCAAGFQTTGDDAVAQAMAKEIFTQNCKTNPDAESQALAKAEMVKTGDQTGSNPNNSSFSLSSSSFDTSDALNAGSGCISDRTVVVAGQTVTLPTSKFCNGFELLGALLVAVSFLSAAVIVLRG